MRLFPPTVVGAGGRVDVGALYNDQATQPFADNLFNAGDVPDATSELKFHRLHLIRELCKVVSTEINMDLGARGLRREDNLPEPKQEQERETRARCRNV